MSSPEEIKCYAPELAHQSDGFPPEKHQRLFNAEKTNFWYRSRSRLIVNAARKYLNREHQKFIEIGCGSANVLSDLSQLKNLELSGAEIYLDALQLAKKRLPEIQFVQMDATNTPFHEEFDGVGMFDVLEHIEEDELVIQNIHKTLKTDGYFLITVPQHQFLWSINDEVAYHKRRYTQKELTEKLQRNGFDVVMKSSFVSTLFPFLLLSRVLKRFQPPPKDPYDAVMQELEMNPLLNKILEFGLRIDEFLIRLGMSLPFGGTLLMVAQKRSHP